MEATDENESSTACIVNDEQEQEALRRLARSWLSELNNTDASVAPEEEEVESMMQSISDASRMDSIWRTELDWDGERLNRSREYYILKAKCAISLDLPIQRQQDQPRHVFVDRSSSPVADDQLQLILFVSHRWESQHHPDPCHVQWKALQRLLVAVKTLADASQCHNDSDRLNMVPSLWPQDYLLAAYLLGTLVFRSGGQLDQMYKNHQAATMHDKGLTLSSFGDFCLSKMGVFYDYTCLPQKPRNQNESKEFDGMLQHLMGLVARTEVLSLRSHQDDFEQRAWCIFENGRRAASVSMNISEPGYILDKTDILMTSSSQNTVEDWEMEAIRSLVARVERWENSGRDVAVANYYGYVGSTWDFFGDIANAMPCLCPPKRKNLPQVMSEKHDLAGALATTLRETFVSLVLLNFELNKNNFSDLDDFYRTSTETINFGDMITEAFRKQNIHITNEKDIGFVGYAIAATAYGKFSSVWGRLALMAVKGEDLVVTVSKILDERPDS
jgi:hypothetical protein